MCRLRRPRGDLATVHPKCEALSPLGTAGIRSVNLNGGQQTAMASALLKYQNCLFVALDVLQCFYLPV